MIPADWTPYRREDDDELLGYMVESSDGLVVPVTVFGYALGQPSDVLDAERVLDSRGLSSLADRWKLAREGHDDPLSVHIIEASPDRLLVSTDFGDRYVLEVPEPGRLSR